MTTFRGTLRLNGKTATGFHVPDEVVEDLGGGRRPQVRVTINGYTYRSSVASMGGEFLLGVSADVREAAGVAAGDELDVHLELDTEPREVAVPDDLRQALDADPAAAAFFAGLNYSARRRVVEPITGAKAAETRQRRVEKAVAMLRDGRA